MEKIFLSFIFIFGSSLTIYSQDEVLDNKARYESFLAGKVENAIIKILGPNQVKVLVDVTMDYNKIEKVEYEKTKSQESFSMAKEAGDTSGIEYLMPGFNLPKIENNNLPKSYTKQLIIPSNLVKKIKVSLIVNQELKDETIKNITDITKEVLSLNEKRGDEIIVMRSYFAPVWKTVWYDPQSVNFMIRYIILSFVGIISLLIVAMGFLKLASAMNTMAKVQQTYQITMEAGNPMGGSPQASLELSKSIPLGLTHTKNSEESEENKESSEKIYFNIKPYQIDALVNLMIKEDPNNVAIVVDHLREDIKKMFITKLPHDFATEVIAGLSQIRFIDKDTIITLKEELETRLEGVTGGISNTLEVLENLGWIEKAKVVKNIKTKYPKLFIELKKHILLFDDLKYFEDKDISIIISSTFIDDWANVFSVLDDEFKEKLKKEFSQTSWKIIEEKARGEIQNELIEKSITNIMNMVGKLITEGRIKKPIYDVSGFIAKE